MLNNDNNILSFFDTIELQSFKNPVLTALLSLLTSFSSNALASNTDSKTERIISAGSAVTEIIEALGAQDQLVAIDVTSEQPKGRALPVVGYHRQLSTEGLMALQPSLKVRNFNVAELALSQLSS